MGVTRRYRHHQTPKSHSEWTTLLSYVFLAKRANFATNILLAVREVIISENLEIVARDFNGAAWNAKSLERRGYPTIGKMFAFSSLRQVHADNAHTNSTLGHYHVFVRLKRTGRSKEVYKAKTRQRYKNVAPTKTSVPQGLLPRDPPLLHEFLRGVRATLVFLHSSPAGSLSRISRISLARVLV